LHRVLVVNRRDNIKCPDQLQLITGAAKAIGRLNNAGYRVAMCTNQPEVARGAMTASQLAEVHQAMKRGSPTREPGSTSFCAAPAF
jgi:D-glycero-D-manno-heptose 1,7-bisphosphate phosphatase